MTVGAWKNWLDGLTERDACRLIQQRQESTPSARLGATQDSRQLPLGSVQETLFIAIRGAWHNGHHYLTEAHAMGARFFIIEEDSNLPALPDSDVLMDMPEALFNA